MFKKIFNNFLSIKINLPALHFQQPQSRTSVWSPNFQEPIVTKDEFDKLKETDPERFTNLQYNKIKSLNAFKNNNLFYDEFLFKLVGRTTRLGERERADKLIKETLFLIKKDRIAKYRELNDEERIGFELNPLKIAIKAWNNCKPTIRVVQVTRGGSKYFAPVPVLEHQKDKYVFRWVRDVIENRPRPRPEKFPVVFARELLLAYKDEGKLIKKKLDLYKLAEANKAYVGYVYMNTNKGYSKR